jgi:predicted 3-demethylubiquinone-9 3-methyltransferase (glyoxalase superfamily)
MQRITPFLWFDNEAENAARLYTSLFHDSKFVSIRRYGDAGPGPKGQVVTLTFQIAGLSVIALNGGPAFHFTPSASFFVTCKSEKEIDALWNKLSEGGKVLMGLQKYQFSEKFGWVVDRYGLSWQMTLAGTQTKVTPFLTFADKQYGKAEEAFVYWSALFKHSKVGQIMRYGPGQQEPEGAVMNGRFILAGQEFMAMDSNRLHGFTFNEAFSLFVDCKTQEEVDRLWEKLSDGGEKGQCGWLKDRYGVSWQIVPSVLGELLGDKDATKSQKVMQAMMQMEKLDIRALREAAR